MVRWVRPILDQCKQSATKFGIGPIGLHPVSYNNTRGVDHCNWCNGGCFCGLYITTLVTQLDNTDTWEPTITWSQKAQYAENFQRRSQIRKLYFRKKCVGLYPRFATCMQPAETVLPQTMVGLH